MVELIKRELYIDAGQKRDRGPAESPIEGFSVFNHGLCCGWLPVKKKKKLSIDFLHFGIDLLRRTELKKKKIKMECGPSMYAIGRGGRIGDDSLNGKCCIFPKKNLHL
jgi:hypothetical protein